MQLKLTPPVALPTLNCCLANCSEMRDMPAEGTTGGLESVWYVNPINYLSYTGFFFRVLRILLGLSDWGYSLPKIEYFAVSSFGFSHLAVNFFYITANFSLIFFYYFHALILANLAANAYFLRLFFAVLNGGLESGCYIMWSISMIYHLYHGTCRVILIIFDLVKAFA